MTPPPTIRLRPNLVPRSLTGLRPSPEPDVLVFKRPPIGQPGGWLPHVARPVSTTNTTPNEP